MPVPGTPSTLESLEVQGLAANTVYYFAIKSIDQANNISAISNCAMGQTYAEESVAPADASDLQAVDVRSTNLTLNWTATGDDGTTGTAAHYDVRMSTSQITQANFDAATQVPNNIVPRESSTPESLFVEGLTPGTTYWFAIKVGDETYNWSAATIISLATPNDQTAPAAVSDLTVTGGDAFSANLTWTATGDDGTNGTASGYEIRYATSQIDANNWDSTSVMPNAIAPQAASSTEQFTVSGLQPGTTYYFAIKVMDEAGNVSAISNGATRTTSADPSLPLITSVTLTEQDGVTTDGYPVMLSQVFKQGDVANNVIVRVSGQYLATQTDVKVRYSADNSVKHALISFILPTLQANQSVQVDILAGGPNANQQPMTRDQLLAKDLDARITIMLDGVPTVISAREMLRHQATVERWIAGDICTEFMIRDYSSNIADQLNVQYRVRVFSGYNGIRIDTVVENCWCDYRGCILYDFDLSIGQLNPQVVLSKTYFWQNNCSRWHKAFWQNSTPSEIAYHYDLPYLISTGLLPNYDTSLVVPETTLSSIYSSWLASAHDLMEPGIVRMKFGATGEYSERPIYPESTVRYLLTGDSRMRDIILSYGDTSGYIPIHFRESDQARTFANRIVSIDDRPTVELNDWDEEQTAQADEIPAPLNTLKTGWEPDQAHQPSLAYVAYMITGDYYYAEEMYFWAGWNLGIGNFDYRGLDAGYIRSETRGVAWATRNIADAASLRSGCRYPRKELLHAEGQQQSCALGGCLRQQR